MVRQNRRVYQVALPFTAHLVIGQPSATIGDLPGIRQRLDYLQWLAVDVIWISPCYPSPMADFGYDVSDYTDIDPIFGTLSDMDQLVEAAHARGLRVILDYVPSHSSDQHPWFIESRSSRHHPKRDWYIWRDAAADGGAPNNWLSRFDGESAWQWDENTGQYYLHSFLKEQPDLNWRHPGLRAAMAALRLEQRAPHLHYFHHFHYFHSPKPPDELTLNAPVAQVTHRTTTF